MLADLSIWHILILVAVVTLLFGTKRIPEIGKSIGKGIQEFKRGLSDVTSNVDEVRPPEPPAPAQPLALPPVNQPKRLSDRA